MARAQLSSAQRLLQAGRFAEAERACRDALRARPEDAPTARLLGQITRLTGRGAESVGIFQQLRRSRPNDLQLVGELGASLTAAGQPAQAYPLLQQAVDAMPTNPAWRLWLGRCLLALFKPSPAIAALREARRLAPDDPEAALALAAALSMAARDDEAVPLLRAFLSAQPDAPGPRVTLAESLEQLGRLDEAIGECRTVLERHPVHEPARGVLARCLHAQGRTAEAIDALRPLVAGPGAPSPNGVVALAPIYLAERRYSECRDLCERALASNGLPAPLRSSLLSALGRARDGLGDHDGAFDAFAEARACFPRSFSRERHAERYRRIREVFSPAGTKDCSGVDGSRCVFIVGMPRSGTTLIEQVLDAHPRVFGAGELNEIPAIAQDLAEALGGLPRLSAITRDQLDTAARRYLGFIDGLPHAGAERIVDKLPHNFEQLGLIARILPNAKIIHATRDPVDTCLSCFTTQLSAWHSYAGDLTDLAFAYAEYRRLMAYWRDECHIPMLEVRYEDTVADLEGQARRVIAHLGLEWDDRCLAFHQSARTVTTASVDQVRRPIYTSSVGRWRRLEHRLAPLLRSLREFGVEV